MKIRGPMDPIITYSGGRMQVRSTKEGEYSDYAGCTL